MGDIRILIGAVKKVKFHALILSGANSGPRPSSHLQPSIPLKYNGSYVRGSKFLLESIPRLLSLL
jgi:hypothetical protein